MTCIAGIVDKGRVFIGGDGAASDGTLTVARRDEKVFRNGQFLFGACGSFRIINLLRYELKPPRWTAGADPYRFMVVDFIGEVRRVLMSAGAAKKGEADGGFLVGFGGRLFNIDTDYQVGEAEAGYDACGSGGGYALASMFSTPRQAARSRILIALKAAAAVSPDVRPPFKILSVGGAA